MSAPVVRPRVTDAQIVDALLAHASNATHAAAALGMPLSTFRKRVCSIPEAAHLRATRPHERKPRRHSDERIVDAYLSGGSYAAAARALGYTGELVRVRLRAMRDAGTLPVEARALMAEREVRRG